MENQSSWSTDDRPMPMPKSTSPAPSVFRTGASATIHDRVLLDKSKVYVCYCDGIGCNASTKTALKLLTLGFQVRELIGGLDWWKRDGYATHGEGAQAESGVRCAC